MIILLPADRKHIQARLAAASKQSMYDGTHFTDPGRMESWAEWTLAGRGRGSNWGPGGWEAEISPLRQPLRL